MVFNFKPENPLLFLRLRRHYILVGVEASQKTGMTNIDRRLMMPWKRGEEVNKEIECVHPRSLLHSPYQCHLSFYVLLLLLLLWLLFLFLLDLGACLERIVVEWCFFGNYLSLNIPLLSFFLPHTQTRAYTHPLN